jgi:hypothetical protein
MLIRESRFDISTSLGIEHGSLIMGSKWVDHWTIGAVCGTVRLQALHRSLPPPPPHSNRVCGCEAGRRICSECETCTEKLCEIK